MRIGFGLIAGVLVLALAVGPSVSAPPDASARVQAAPETARMQTPPGTARIQVAPSARLDLNAAARPQGAQQSTPVGVSYFSGQECHDLGGDINLDTAGICSSGQLCKRVDNQGVEHRICITVGQ
jgi:hypothetical protein